MTEAAEGTPGNSGEKEWMGCNVDFGNGQSLELDYRKSDGPWLSNGPGIAVADVWFKGEKDIPDLRIHIARTPEGIRVLVDRGQQSSIWWSAEALPQLKITLDQRTRTALASASIGLGDDFQEVLLGTTAF
jgi:hypothetical protein